MKIFRPYLPIKNSEDMRQAMDLEADRFYVTMGEAIFETSGVRFFTKSEAIKNQETVLNALSSDYKESESKKEQDETLVLMSKTYVMQLRYH